MAFGRPPRKGLDAELSSLVLCTSCELLVGEILVTEALELSGGERALLGGSFHDSKSSMSTPRIRRFTSAILALDPSRTLRPAAGVLLITLYQHTTAYLVLCASCQLLGGDILDIEALELVGGER